MKERRKKASIRTQNDFSRELTADELLQVRLGRNKVVQDVKKTIGDGDAPVATKNVPKLSAPTPAENQTHDEDAVGPKEIKLWSDLGLRQTKVMPHWRT